MGIQDRKARLFKEREQEILSAALELFRRDDWQSVTIEQIAERAEIGKGTVYKHFSTKLDIYAALALEFMGGMLERIQAIDPEQDPLDYMRAVARVVWEAHMSSREHHRVFQYCHQEGFRNTVSPPMRERLDQTMAAMFGTMGGVLQRGVREGLFPDKPIPMLTFGAQSALWGAIDLVWAGCIDIDPEEYLEQITRFILAGLMHQEDTRVVGRTE